MTATLSGMARSIFLVIPGRAQREPGFRWRYKARSILLVIPGRAQREPGIQRRCHALRWMTSSAVVKRFPPAHARE